MAHKLAVAIATINSTVMESRLSMLHVVKNGLLSSGRTTYLHRMLYVGEHKLGRGLEEVMKNVVSSQAELAREEGLSGFLMVYPNHFIHIVEGSESTLTKHLRAVVDPTADEAAQIGRVKVIFEITHINKRCMNSWSSRTATPPTLASQVKQRAPAPVAEIARHADAVLTKTLRMLDAVKKLPPGAPLSQQVTLQLPEPELLQALLATTLIKDVRVVLEEQRVPPRITLYDDAVWPAQSDFVPYNLLEEPIEVLHGAGEQKHTEGQKDEDNDEDEEEGEGEETASVTKKAEERVAEERRIEDEDDDDGKKGVEKMED